jgi:hypothetical protein
MAALVEQMLALHRRRAAARTPNEQTVLQAQIDATDRQIDRLVYELYGLTEEEVRIVEGWVICITLTHLAAACKIHDQEVIR